MEKLTYAEEKKEKAFLSASLQRRSFLKYAGAGAASIALLAAGCDKDDEINGVYFGTGDIAILNYAYALEQLEAAFYTQVVATQYASITAMETSYLTDIRDHEIAHREFFKAALGVNAIAALEVNFSSINFNSRDSVLATAKAFEDLGVSAYNGAGFLIQNPEYLTLAGKIVSVEARHAALIRDLISNGTFVGTDVLDGYAMEKSRSPSEVLAIAGAYIKTAINVEGLPTY
ncbi:ferritin-like domain-containing protein [Hufsiella ginkgonis]|uniref:Ferritin-like domain-containing protein n=1 Tax=Hufsiella ginkgonis TaxID=2695274 RepID=A0A7K1XYC6_9SPHI|nr:ferritin-like domain-containing protein [Hufsiella ginkgonis]MXV15952.1 ferritin-like domain-containing protein [Hufsiella ginkgonis]